MIRSRPIYSSSRATRNQQERPSSPRPPAADSRTVVAGAVRGGGLESSPGRPRVAERAHAGGGSGLDGEDSTDRAGRLRTRLAVFYRSHEKPLLLATGVVAALLAVLLYGLLSPDPPRLTESDIEASVLATLDSLPEEPSVASQAYEIIRPSVVRVRRLSADTEDDSELGVGTGVVIVNTGVILTSLHVVAGAERVTVVFADGFETEATVASVQPEDDLAVLQAEVIPEGLVPATLASSASLRVGDEVVAVGTPFGIGSSASAGVVSGLGRSYTSESGDALLSNLIQFDAAANPGNSGGPLVNRRGEVVGIVTAIFNPTNQRVFIGIGFAVPIDTAASAAGPSPF